MTDEEFDAYLARHQAEVAAEVASWTEPEPPLSFAPSPAARRARRKLWLSMGIVLGAYVVMLTSAAFAETVTGSAHVLDGDTIKIAGTRVRLHGIDAPETAQRCWRADSSSSYGCGDESTARLMALTIGKTVACEGPERDHYGRLIGACTADGVELNRTMVREGQAWAFTRYSTDYAAEEAQARTEHRGVFAAENQPPWEFRAERYARASTGEQAPAGCIIKGNISRKGERIYHLPWQADYGRTRISTTKGERWFCDEGEAENAGWRRAAR